MKFVYPLSVASVSTPSLVAKRVHEAIVSGELRPGDRLPSEFELAQGFGIALMTVRGALTALRDMGLLTTVRGRHGGNFIAEDVGDRLAEAARKAPLNRALLRDLTDWRRAISGEACYLAAERSTPEQLSQIRSLEQAFNSTDQFPDLRFADVRLHVAIAEASGSSRLIRAETELQVALTDVILSTDRPVRSRKLTSYDHGPIVQAIELGHAAQAREAMIRHAEDTFNWAVLLV
ncbi:FadR/GntR family transcriptional regulator [Rhizobium giardinii]|uniref:DNA-binding FadR family transcriptional regulator n=1 Tax=Rhizobium giardinii TaxID=56731 RepID=A0A7W8UID3_9HYPH|nr:FCD domain-containing protein [Rhizobium giardinii]MBB5539142.1 DNA-binding FadR family transcriptional regulator [Rhizobium giardinii]